MEYYVEQLTCKECGAALSASGELRAGMVLVCEHCDTPYVVCERDFRTSRPADADAHDPNGSRHVHTIITTTTTTTPTRLRKMATPGQRMGRPPTGGGRSKTTRPSARRGSAPSRPAAAFATSWLRRTAPSSR